MLGWEPEIDLDEGLRRWLARSCGRSPSVRRGSRWLRAAVIAAVAARRAACRAAAAVASRHMQVGIYDERADALRATRRPRSRCSRKLHVQVVRVNLYWGGPPASRGGGRRSPADPRRPRLRLERATTATCSSRRRPASRSSSRSSGRLRWANGGQELERRRRRTSIDLRDFAYAAAARYSGTYAGADGRTCPAVRAGSPGTSRTTRSSCSRSTGASGGNWVIAERRSPTRRSATRSTAASTRRSCRGEQVACGVTAPRGNNNPTSARPSVSPLAFLRARSKKAGLKTFDAWAHHPYYGERRRDADDEAGTATAARRPRSRSGTSAR